MFSGQMAFTALFKIQLIDYIKNNSTISKANPKCAIKRLSIPMIQEI